MKNPIKSLQSLKIIQHKGWMMSKKTFFKLGALASIAALLTACASNQPYQAYQQPYQQPYVASPAANPLNALQPLVQQNLPMQTQAGTGVQSAAQTAVGALIGAGLGNLIGGGGRQGTLIGTALGAGLGYQFGDYIRQALFGLNPNLAVDVPVNTNNPNSNMVAPVRITLPEYVAFDSASSTLKFDAGMSNSTLNQVAQTLKNPSYQYASILVVGHTDAMGDAGFNQQLSFNRASVVSNYLAQQGLDARRIRAEGRGAAQPVSDNATVEGRARNRRVEIIVMPA